jgi:hypothetical protein
MSKKSISEGITNVGIDVYSKIVKPSGHIILLYTGTSHH